MTPYRYLKKTTKTPKKQIFPKSLKRRISFSAIAIGFLIFGSATGPILSYELFTSPRFQTPDLATPLSSQNSLTLGAASALPDLTKAANWFPAVPLAKATSSKISHYTISIPKLKIYSATVKIGGEDLSKSLIQYAGTSLPGQPGNTVILGHSVLPQFFDPRSYLTIFSTLPTLKSGDDFYISYDGIQYKYIIEDMVEVEPTDFTILEQRFDDVFTTLITCVPPGLKTRRLAVRGRLVNNPKPFIAPAKEEKS